MRRLVLLLLVALLGACATPAPPPGPDAGRTRIGFAVLEFEEQAYAPLVKAFNEANPDLEVVLVPLGPEIFRDDAAEQARALAGAADTFSAMLAGPGAAESPYLADLRPLMDADATFDRRDYRPSALPQSGPQRVLPATLHVMSASYSRDLWRAAGLPEPAASWSWDELLAAAEQLTQRQGDKVLVAGLDDGQDGALVLQGLLAEAGVGMAPADGVLDLRRPAIAAALARVADLIERGVIFTRPEGDLPGGAVGGAAVAPAIGEGRRHAAIWLGAELALPQGAQPADPAGDLALPPLPRDQLISVSGYAISAGSAHPEAAWRWLRHLSGQQPDYAGAVMVFGNGTDVPALADAPLGEMPPERAAALRATLERAEQLPPPADPLVSASLAAALAAVRKGGAPDQALADADAQLAEQLRARAARPAATPQPVTVQLPEPTVIPEGAAVVRFSALGFSPDPVTLRQLVDQFNAQQRAVHVELVQPSFGGADGGAAPGLAQLARGLDCLSWEGPLAPADRAALLDLRPLLDAAPTPEGQVALRDDYPEGLLAPLRDGDRLYGLPHSVALRALTYNRASFRAAGLDAPRADWQLAELLDAAARLTERDGAAPRYGYAIAGDAASDLLAFLAWQGAAPIGAVQEPRLTDPAVVQALGSYVELLRTSSPHTRLPGYRSDDALAIPMLDQDGRVGMWFSSSPGGMFSVLLGEPAAAPPDLAVAPPPLGGRGLSSADYSASALLIPADSAQPAACLAWMTFLSEQTAGLGERFPARTSVAEGEPFAQQARPGAAELYAAYADALRRPAEGGAGYRGFDPFWLLQAVDRALQGGDLGRELEQAQALTEQHLACVRSGGEAQTCAKSVDASYAGVGVLR